MHRHADDARGEASAPAIFSALPAPVASGMATNTAPCSQMRPATVLAASPIRPIAGGGHLGPLSYVYGYRGGIGWKKVGQDTTGDDDI